MHCTESDGGNCADGYSAGNGSPCADGKVNNLDIISFKSRGNMNLLVADLYFPDSRW